MLRAKFLSADVGVTGANFLVAETGASIIVTNEGNGDLTQILPKAHIVIASLEKIVPTMEDAAQLLRVLARSATGQDASVYTTFSTGPRRPDDPDGPSEYHVVLLDNGRSSMLGGEFEDMLRCIRCGACMNHCPVYQAVGGHAYGWVYPGPMGAVLTPSLIGVAEGGQLPNASTFCGRCEAVCPVRIPLPKMMRHWREREFERSLSPAPLRYGLGFWAFFARRPTLYRLGDRPRRARDASRRTRQGTVLLGFRSRAAGPDTAISPRRSAPPFRASGAPRAGRRNERARGDLRQYPPLARRDRRRSARACSRSEAGWRRRRPASCRGAGRATSALASRRSRRRPRGSRPPSPRSRSLAEVPAEVARFLRDNNCPASLRMGADERLSRDALERDVAGNPARPVGRSRRSAVSMAFAGIAETGTLALVSGPANPTTLNFLPDNHIVVLRKEDVVADYESVFARLRAAYGKGGAPRTLNFITGPSRSADIEQTLLLGAHGPRRLHIVIAG